MTKYKIIVDRRGFVRDTVVGRNLTKTEAVKQKRILDRVYKRKHQIAPDELSKHYIKIKRR